MAFGEVFVDLHNNRSTPYRFTGKEQDCETGLYYYGARYYDARIGRFMSVDPLAGLGPQYSLILIHLTIQSGLQIQMVDGQILQDGQNLLELGQVLNS